MKTFITLIFWVLILNRAGAQQTENTDVTDTVVTTRPTAEGVWLNVGLGTNTGGVSSIIGSSVQSGHFIGSVHFSRSSRILGEGLWDWGALMGYATDPGPWHFSLAGGFGFMGGRQKDNCVLCPGRYDTPMPATFGVPVEIQITRKAAEHLGIGLYGYCNLNRVKSLFGLALDFHVGKLP